MTNDELDALVDDLEALVVLRAALTDLDDLPEPDRVTQVLSVLHNNGYVVVRATETLPRVVLSDLP